MESLTLTEGTQTARGQADNPLWFDLHKGHITASKFINHQVCLRPSYKYYTQSTGRMAMIKQR